MMGSECSILQIRQEQRPEEATLRAELTTFDMCGSATPASSDLLHGRSSVLLKWKWLAARHPRQLSGPTGRPINQSVIDGALCSAEICITFVVDGSVGSNFVD